MAWAKLHTDILGDPKLMRAARKGGRELVYLPWFIAFAKLADDGGRLTVGGEPADPVDISDLIPEATARRVSTALKSLEAIGVLLRDNDGALRFARWDVRSEAKPSDSPSAIAERVKRHREKQRNADGNALHETPSNALHETPDNATEKRRGEEKREEKKRGEARGADAPPPAWLPAIRARWQTRVGRITPAVLTRELSAVVELHGEPAVLTAIDAYADARLEQGKPPKLAWFAEEAAVWIERAAPVVGADGIPTERGMAILAGGSR
jgi:hypothetical protein